MRRLLIGIVPVLALLAVTATGQMIINGEADDLLYGDPPTQLALQNTQTGFGDNSMPDFDLANGSEMDAAYAVVYDGYLYLVLAGNFENNGNKVEIFFDTATGGYNQLDDPNNLPDQGGLHRMAFNPLDPNAGPGLKFETDFEADYYVSVNAFGDPVELHVDYAELGPTGLGYYCGQGTHRCDPNTGPLSGADPNAPVVFVSLDNSNIYGVTGGFGSEIPDDIYTGIEIAIPLSAIGSPAGEFDVVAFINGSNHAFLSNQVFEGDEGWYGDNFGEPRLVDFSTIINDQFITIPTAPTPKGACCNGPVCSITTQAGCSGGTYQGDNTRCYGDYPCDASDVGACCDPNGACTIETLADCTALGGSWDTNANCDYCPCAQLGACCDGESCSLMFEADCLLSDPNAVYLGDFTDCGADPNENPCLDGACCYDSGDPNEPRYCTEVRVDECSALTNGTWKGPNVTCASNPCGCTIQTPYVAGSMQGWNNNSHPMISIGSNIWELTFTGLTPNNREEFKITDGTWDNTLPSSNSWLYTDSNGEITITYDCNFYSDGWAPDRDRLGLSYDPGIWTAVGDWQGWNNADPNTVMVSQGGGIYMYEGTGTAAGTHYWKAVYTGTWDSISWNARSINTENMEFTLSSTSDIYRLYVDGLIGVVKVEVVSGDPCAGQVRGDVNCDGSINSLDIDPFVAVLTGGAAVLPCTWECVADTNCDSSVNSLDIDPFVAILTGNGACCKGGGVCELYANQAACEGDSGTWLGAGTNCFCDGDQCP